ncbi:pilus assembly protein PilP [Photobacterium leiognathi]|uniref:Fimbrial assembly protein PilP, putative n=3 Tax=Photobacterium leiognathi TaxID=553611 RepID=A0A0U1P8R5_PHOLE|nr:pilus assembly protein PilP [Photobacterium leiognathi]KJF90835.1 pilus assembly protein PilQ [Photobacterium leiognathi]KJF99665.1 pilus assembly protein PilQ [Photobacterium leiognathi]MCG3885158.1 pilus assembly protein PilP [Photobacterium leiognathi]PHZ59449.1 pilus assembly protein PilQ [Photobacterium leiognathi]PSV12524.1 pilus assembly protein PilQ [Photobacterium leiognathi subsp. mandapamensis]
MKKVLWLLPIVIGLVGCKANDDSVEQFIATTHSEAKARVKPLPESFVFTAETFVMTSKRVPFVKPIPEQLLAKEDTGTCWQPQLDRPLSKLEEFALEKLAMKGAIGNNKQLWGLVFTPEGDLMKIKPGQYIGLNRGKVLTVSDKEIEIEETLPDGKGCWLKRPTKLALVQQ